MAVIIPNSKTNFENQLKLHSFCFIHVHSHHSRIFNLQLNKIDPTKTKIFVVVQSNTISFLFLSEYLYYAKLSKKMSKNLNSGHL